MLWYILIDREFCTLYNDAVHFFQIFIFCFFSVYYYKMSLREFWPNFLYEHKLTKALLKQPEKLTRHLAMILLMNALFDVGLRNFVPQILASKISPKVVDLL